MDLAAQIMERVAALGGISDEPERLTRVFAGPGMRRANDLVRSWMEQAGMTVREDAIGNLIGHFSGGGEKTLLLGSHLDTVRDAGRFDGALGVLLAIACVAEWQESGRALPFSLDVIAFADEEGARYQTAYLGSRAVAGKFDLRDLDHTDASGITMARAIREFGGDPAQMETCRWNGDGLIGYVEAHIEQGPVLDNAAQAVGIVTAIAGQTRARIEFRGNAGHAGTVPMGLRHDALCAAAEFILEVEKIMGEVPGLVATVGQISVQPNVGNVIPGAALLSLDVRHQNDARRKQACSQLLQRLGLVDCLPHIRGQRRGIESSWQTIQETPSVPCSPTLSALLREAALKHQPQVLDLCSGAGHDAAVMAGITPAAMLFVRCRDGISHHPDESARSEDVATALAVLCEFISVLAEHHEHL